MFRWLRSIDILYRSVISAEEERIFFTKILIHDKAVVKCKKKSEYNHCIGGFYFKKLVDNWKTENEIKRMPRNAEICQISK